MLVLSCVNEVIETSDCDTEDDSYVEALVKKEAGLDNKTQRLDNKTQGLDNSVAQRQELDDSAQGPEVLDNKTQSPDNKAPIIKLVNTKFTVATQVLLFRHLLLCL